MEDTSIDWGYLARLQGNNKLTPAPEASDLKPEEFAALVEANEAAQNQVELTPEQLQGVEPLNTHQTEDEQLRDEQVKASDAFVQSSDTGAENLTAEQKLAMLWILLKRQQEREGV